jgi:TolB-like protein/Flp pilus assembly protein TadD
MSLFGELKRRNVYRVAALYVIVSWLVLQVVDVFMSFMPLPEWTERLVFVLLAAGFPVALVLAWAIELTPDGIKLERSSSGKGPSRRRGDLVLYGVLAIVIGVTTWQFAWPPGEDDASPTRIRSLVVLPLDNLMNDPAQDYFVEGMHEALITELSRIEALRVISRTSAMTYHDSKKSVPEIGEELNVDAVIEGSVLRAGDTVRVTAQLIDARNDRHLWADNFDRELTDILGLYADVTRNIASNIRIKLTPEQSARLELPHTVDADAYDQFLKGNYACDQWTPDSMRDGIDFMRRAVRTEPGNARYQAGLAQCLQYASFYDYVSPVEIFEEASAAARRAVDLDETSSEAWTAFASVRYYLDYDTVAADLALKRAVELNPSNVRANIHYSWLRGEAGELDAALELAEQALRLDPLSPMAHTTSSQAYYLSQEYESALVEYGNLLRMDPDGPTSHFYMGWVLEQMGRYDEAIAQHRKAIELSVSEPLFLAGLGYSYGLAGRTAEAEQILQQLLADEQAGAIHIALVQIGLGNNDEAISWLEKAIDARQSHVLYIRQDAKFDPLREDPRFEALVRRVGW